jgi:inner membrane protein
MDNLTHSLVGVLMSRAGFNRVVPHATALLLLAANAPDCDVISYLYGRSFGPGGSECYLHYHRGITHSIVATPVIALLPVLIVRLVFWRRPMQWLRTWLVATAGVASHWLLDLTNPYGIRLMLPWSNAWPALDIFSVIDVWIWAALLLSVLWPMLARLVSSEIGARSGIGKGWAIFGLAFLVVYGGVRWFLHQRAVAVQEARLYDGRSPRRVLALPTPVNPLVWRGIVETDDSWVTQTFNINDYDPTRGRVWHKPSNTGAIEAARRTSPFETLGQFSRALLWRLTPSEEIEGGTKVEAIDLRFSFTAVAIVDSANQVRRTSLHF